MNANFFFEWRGYNKDENVNRFALRLRGEFFEREKISWEKSVPNVQKQGRKRPLDTPKRERKKGRRREREREVKGIEREGE